MSFLIRKVLGQNVVHPPPSKPSTARNVQHEQDTASDLQTKEHTSDKVHSDRHENGTNDVEQVRTKYSSKDSSYTSNSKNNNNNYKNSNEVTESLPVTSSFNMQSAEESVATATRTPPAPRSTHTNTSTPATTLLLRLQTCTILQDLRDTLQELLNCIDLPLIIGPSEFASLVEFLRAYAQDDTLIVETTLHILVNLTDISHYPGSEQTHKTENSTTGYYNNETKGHNSRKDDAKRNSADYSALTINEKRHICDSFTRVLVKHATLLLNFVKRGQHTTQSRLYAIQLLTRLEEFDAAQMHKVLLASHGASVLVDVLVEESNDVSLLQRNVLSLLRSMTMIDTELQTLLAFDNAFEALAQLLDVVGGVNGGDVALECLGIMHNMLRSNKATQKYFREMEYARLLTPLFVSVHEELMSKIKSATITTSTTKSSLQQQQTQQSMSSVDVDFCGKLPLHESMNLLQYSKETSTILLLAMAIFSCLLRESEANHDEYMLTQSNLLECEVLEQLVNLALCGVVADDATRIEALRTITLLIKGHKPAITSFVEMDKVLTIVRSTSPNIVMQWTSLRALMHYLFTSYDVILLTTTAHLMEAVCTRQECQPNVLDVLLNGFSPHAGTLLCNNMNAAASEIPNAITHMRSHYMNDYGKWLANTQLARCGEVFAWTLFTRMPSSELLNNLHNNSSSSVTHGKYFAVQLLRQLLRMPFMASSLTLLPWENLELNETSQNTFSVENTITAQSNEQSKSNNKNELKNINYSDTTTNTTVNTNHHNNNNTLGEEGTFFHAFASYVVRCLRGEHVQQGMDSATLGAYVETLLVWLKESDKAVNILVHSRDGLYTKLLECARESNAAQLRLYCAIIAAVVCVEFTQITKKASHEENNMYIEYITNNAKECVNNENVSNVVLAPNVLTEMEDKSVLHNDYKSVAKQPLTQHLEMEKIDYLDLYSQFISYLGGPAFFDSVLFDINASNSQWAHPTPSAFLIVAHVTYNVEFVELIKQVIEGFRALHQELLQIKETATTTRTISGDEYHYGNAHQENTRESNPFTENAEASEQSIMSKQNYNAPQEGKKHEKDEEVEVTRETRLQQAEQFVNRDTNEKNVTSRHDVQELQEQIIKLHQEIHSQTSELKLLHDENERLQSELAELHMRYTEQIREMENEHTNYRVTEANKQQEQPAEPETTVTTSTENTTTQNTLSEYSSTEMLNKEVETLRESVHLLEETVNNNEDERQHLLRTIEMMEEELRSKPKEAAAAICSNEIKAPEVMHKTPLHTNTLSVQTEMESKHREVEYTNANEIVLYERINEMQAIIHALETERDELLCVLGEISEARPVTPATEDSKLQTLTNNISNNNNTNANDNNSVNMISNKEHEQSKINMKTNQSLPYEVHNNNDKNIADVNYNQLIGKVDNDDNNNNGSNDKEERLQQEHPIYTTVLENKEIESVEETDKALYYNEHQIPVQSGKLSAETLLPYTVYNSGECNLQNNNQQNNMNSNTNYVDMSNVVEDVENVFDDHTLQTDENPFADEDDGFGGNIASIDNTDFMSQLHKKLNEDDLR